MFVWVFYGCKVNNMFSRFSICLGIFVFFSVSLNGKVKEFM